MIDIVEVKTKKQLKAFASYPLKLYKDCPYYVPSLRSDEMNTFNPKKNFSLKNCSAKGFLAYKDGELVGRIAGLINYGYNDITGKKYIRFSRFECIDDLEVFKALLNAVEKFGAENGMEIIHGPWGFNDTDREGMLTDGFDRVSTYATNYYYPYFSQNMVKLGYEDESKWLERKFKITPDAIDRMKTLGDKLKKRLEIVDVAESMSVKQILSHYGDKLLETITESYQHLDGYVPISAEEWKNVLSQFATIVNKKYISILIDKKGDVAGFGIVLPSIRDALKKHKGKLFPIGFISVLKSIAKPKALEMALLGVKKEYQNSGLTSIIVARILKNMVDNKIDDVESNPMLESNYNIQQTWKFIENEVIKHRQTYKKDIVKA